MVDRNWTVDPNWNDRSRCAIYALDNDPDAVEPDFIVFDAELFELTAAQAYARGFPWEYSPVGIVSLQKGRVELVEGQGDLGHREYRLSTVHGIFDARQVINGEVGAVIRLLRA